MVQGKDEKQQDLDTATTYHRDYFKLDLCGLGVYRGGKMMGKCLYMKMESYANSMVQNQDEE